MGYSWLNKDSREFLSRGYIKEGQEVEDRVKEICNTAEKILGTKGFSNKLESYVAKGWVSFSSPVWANFGQRALAISCITGDTWVLILFFYQIHSSIIFCLFCKCNSFYNAPLDIN